MSLNESHALVVEPLRKLERMGRENQLQGAADLQVNIGKEFERVKLFLKENLHPVSV